MYLIYDNTGRMIGLGYHSQVKVDKAARKVSSLNPLDCYSVVDPTFTITKKFKGGQIVKKAMRAHA